MAELQLEIVNGEATRKIPKANLESRVAVLDRAIADLDSRISTMTQKKVALGIRKTELADIISQVTK